MSYLITKLASLKNIGIAVLTALLGVFYFLYKAAEKKSNQLQKDNSKLENIANTSAETIKQEKKSRKMLREYQKEINAIKRRKK